MIQVLEYPRTYLPAEFDPASPEEAKARFDELAARPIEDVASLRAWLHDYDELITAISEERSRRHVTLTCNTNDESAEEAFQTFLTTMDPLVKERSFELEKRILDCPAHAELEKDRYGEFLDAVRTRQRLFRKENIPLQMKEVQLGNAYDKLVGASEVEFEGKTYPLSRMKLFTDDPDRGRRERAWRAYEARVHRDSEAYENLLDQLVVLRTRIAKNAGYRDFIAYRFAEWRRPYQPADCRAFHDAVETHVVPVLKRLQEIRRTRLGLESLRPWDIGVDVKNRSPLRPFKDAPELIALCKNIFGKIEPEFASRLEWMERNDLLDLDSRSGKAPGGYMCALEERRVPFIFMNAAGVQGDVRTLLHEGGHAFHVFECRALEPSFNRDAPIEFAEVASMSMELAALDVLDEFYKDGEADRVRLEQLEGIVRILTWIATIDRFQLDLYGKPDHTREERRSMWLDSYRRFRGDMDFTGLEQAEAERWHLQPHIFGHALYYIEYAIAQIGALQVWRNCRKDRAAGVRAYRNGLALGGTKPLPELFRAAGARFDFGAKTIGELMGFLSKEIEALDGR